MNKLVKLLPAICLLLQFWQAQADTVKKVTFQNQREESFDLENFLKSIEYKDEEVKDTCYKDVPYEEKVCKDVTKYKKECKTIPAHQECKDVNRPVCHSETRTHTECETPTHRECHTETSPVCHNETRYETQCSTTPDEQQCRTVNEPICRNETRYEQECRTVPGEQQCRVVIRYHEECNQVPGGRQCHQVPPDIRCRIINGENKCEKIPGHEECSDQPSRRECHQAPYEERECSTGPSRQECHQVPRTEQVCENHSRQECTTLPGRQHCEQVPRTEQVCETRSHQECTDVPGTPICTEVPRTEQVCEDHMEKVCANVPAKEECKKVPYKENVCKMETKIKKEPYECTKTVQVPHEVIKKTHRAHVQLNFNNRSKDATAEFKISLSDKGQMNLDALNFNQTQLLIFAKKDIKAEENADINTISALYKLILMDKEDYFRFIESGLSDVELYSHELHFTVAGKIDLKRSSLFVSIAKKGQVKFEKVIHAQFFETDFDGEKTHVSIDLKKSGAPTFGGIFNREHSVKLKLSVDMSDLGENLGEQKIFESTRTLDLKVQ